MKRDCHLSPGHVSVPISAHPEGRPTVLGRPDSKDERWRKPPGLGVRSQRALAPLRTSGLLSLDEVHSPSLACRAFSYGIFALVLLFASVARAGDGTTTSVPNECTSAGGTGMGCGTDAQCANNAYATRCVQLVAGDATSRHCEIPCDSDTGTAVESECAVGETCVTAGGDGSHYCQASRFRVDLNLVDLAITDFLTGNQPLLGSDDQCSLEANLDKLLDQNGDGKFDIFDMDLIIQALLDEPKCDPTTGTCPSDDLVFCNADSDCGSGLHCDTSRNVCERECGLVASREMGFADIDRQCAEPLTTCDYSKGTCVPVDLSQTSCQVDQECPAGAYCFLGQCAPLCYRSIDCPGSDWYCTDNNRCRTLPSPNAQPGFVFIPKNYALLFGEPAVSLNDVQTDSSDPILIMDLITKRQVATNPSVSFGYRVEVTYNLKDDPKCRQDPSQWSDADRADCILGDDKHFVMPVAPFGTVFAVGNPKMPVSLDPVAASHLTPGKYSANFRVIFDNGSSDSFQVLYEKTTPSGEYTGTYSVALGGADNNLAPNLPLNLAMKLHIEDTQESWTQLLEDQGIQATSQDYTNLSSGYVVKGLVHGDQSLAFANTTDPTGKNEIPLTGLYSPELGWMRLLWIVDLPAGFCVDENGVCPSTGATTNLVADNVFGRRIRRVVQLFGTYDDAAKRFYGIYREAISGLVPQATDLTLNGSFLLTQAVHDESDFDVGPVLPADAPATVSYPAVDVVTSELDQEIETACGAVVAEGAAADASATAVTNAKDAQTAQAKLASQTALTSYLASLASGGSAVFPKLVSFEQQISDALAALGTNGTSGNGVGPSAASNDTLSIYDFLSGQITICGTDQNQGPESTPTPACIDENVAECGLALYRRAIVGGWVPPFATSDTGNHQLFCSQTLPTADCENTQNQALEALHEYTRFDQQLAQARKFQADHDLSDAFYALYRNQVNPFGKGEALSFKQEKLESSVQFYNELLENMVGPAPTDVLFGWPVQRFQGDGSEWVQEMESILTDRLNALQQLVDLHRRVLETSGLSDRPLAEQLAQEEYLVSVYLLALQRQWAGPNFTYDGIGDTLLQRMQSILLQLDDAKNPLGISPNLVFFENSNLNLSNWQNYRQELVGDDGQSGLLGEANTEISQAVDNLKASLSDMDTFEANLSNATGAYQNTIQSLCGVPTTRANECAALEAQIAKDDIAGTMDERKCTVEGGQWDSASSTCSGVPQCDSASALNLGDPDVCKQVTDYFTTNGANTSGNLSNLSCPYDGNYESIKVDGADVPCVGGTMGGLLGQKEDLVMQVKNLDAQVGNILANVRNMTAYIKAKNDATNSFNTTITGLQAASAALELAVSITDRVFDSIDAFSKDPDCMIIVGFSDGTDCPGHIVAQSIDGTEKVVQSAIDGALETADKGLTTAIDPLSRANDQTLDQLSDKNTLEDMLAQLQGIGTQYQAALEDLLSVYSQMEQVQLQAQAASDGQAQSIDYVINHLIGRENGSVLLGNYLVSKSADTFRQALDTTYRMVMAFAHQYNLSDAQLEALESQVYQAITVEDLQAVVTQLDQTARDYCGQEAIDCDAFNNLSVLRLSLRDALFPNLRDVVDPTTGQVVTKGQQFFNLITEPPFLKRRIVGTHTVDQIELPFVIWLPETGDPGNQSWMVNPLECNHTLDWEPNAQGDGPATAGDVAVNFVGDNLDKTTETIHYQLERGDVDWLRACHPVATTQELGTAPVLQYPIDTYLIGYAPQSQFGQESQPPTFYSLSSNLAGCLDSAESNGAPEDNCWQLFARDRSLAAPDWKVIIPLWVDGADAGNAWIAGAGLPDAKKPVVSDIVLYLRYRTRPISEQ